MDRVPLLAASNNVLLPSWYLHTLNKLTETSLLMCSTILLHPYILVFVLTVDFKAKFKSNGGLLFRPSSNRNKSDKCLPNGF